MRKDILLPVFAFTGGAAGFALRQVQLRQAYDPETMLFVSGHPVTYALLALFVLWAAVLAILLTGGRREMDAEQLCCPSSLYITLMAVSAFLFLGGGALGVMEGMRQLTLSMQLPALHPMSYPIALLLCAGLSAAAGLTTLLFGRAMYRRRWADPRSAYVLGVPFAALLFLFSYYLSHSIDPILLHYGIVLFAIVCLLLGHYVLAALFHTKGRPRAAVWFLLMGSVLRLTSLWEDGGIVCTVLLAALSVSALANSAPLLRALYGPAWPDPLPGDEEEADEEPDDTQSEHQSSDEESR